MLVSVKCLLNQRFTEWKDKHIILNTDYIVAMEKIDPHPWGLSNVGSEVVSLHVYNPTETLGIIRMFIPVDDAYRILQVTGADASPFVNE